MTLQVASDSLTHGGKESLFPHSREQSKAFQFIFDRILHFGKTQFDSRGRQRIFQFTQNVSGRHVDAGDRFRCHDEPHNRRWRIGHGVEHPAAKQLGVREEQWRIPPEQNKARHDSSLWIPGDVMVALQVGNSAENGIVGTPAVPEKLEYRDPDRDSDARNCPEYGNAYRATDRQPEFGDPSFLVQ